MGCTEGARARCPPIAKWISETREEIFDIFWIEDSPAQRVRNKRDDSVFAIPRHGTRSGARAMLAPGASAVATVALGDDAFALADASGVVARVTGLWTAHVGDLSVGVDVAERGRASLRAAEGGEAR